MYYDPKYDFHQVSVDYINRGAPGNRSTIEGDCICSLESWGMEIQSDTGIAFIPYHRILRIQYEGDLIWERGMREQIGHKKAPDNHENENLALYKPITRRINTTNTKTT
jgi:uncharacterized protein